MPNSHNISWCSVSHPTTKTITMNSSFCILLSKLQKTRKWRRLNADTLCDHLPDLWSFELETGTPATPALRNVHTNFGISTPFSFPLRSP